MDYTPVIAATKRAASGFSPQNAPQEMRKRHQWVIFRKIYNQEKDRIEKVCFDPSYTNRGASTTDSTTWSGFDHAVSVFRANPTVDGVGFVFSEADPYFGADFDNCRDPETGKLDPWVRAWLEHLGGYAEISPSGRGVHVIGRGRLPGRGRKRVYEGHEVELYDRGRFFTVTGWALREGAQPEDAQEVVEELYRLVSPPPKVERQIRRLSAPVLGDDEVLDKARTAANGWKFARLYDRGNWKGLNYPSQSEADSALAYLLAFWTAGDREQIIRLFERSALYRSQEKHSRYLEITVDGALGSYDGPYYDPEHRSEGVREALEPYFRLLHTPIKGRKWPSARKVLAAILLAACEHGTRTKNGVRVGLDVRTIVEVAHVSSRTLLYSSLPLLVGESIVRWVDKGDKKNAGAFLLPLPVIESKTLITHTCCVLLSISPVTLGNEERRELLRASQGRTPHGALARVGNAQQVILEHLVGTPGNRLTTAALSERTGRLCHNVRASMRRLCGYNLVVEITPDEWALPADFWDRWYGVLMDSGVIKSESVRKQRHQRDREARDLWKIAVWHSELGVFVEKETGEVLSVNNVNGVNGEETL